MVLGDLVTDEGSYSIGTCSNPIPVKLIEDGNGFFFSAPESEWVMRVEPASNDVDTHCMINNDPSEACFTACIIDNDGSCDGNKEYCTNYSCDTGAVCFCQTVGIEFDNTVGGKVLDPPTVQSVCYKPNEETEDSIKVWESRRILTLEDPPLVGSVIQVLLLDMQMSIWFTTSAQRQAFITSDSGVRQSEEPFGTKALIFLKPEFFAKSQTMTLRVYEGALLIHEESFDIIGSSFVRVYDCIFCSGFFQSFAKMPMSVQIAGVLAYGSLFGSFLVFFYWFFGLFAGCFAVCMLIGKKCGGFFSSCYKKFVRDPYMKLKDEAKSGSDDVEEGKPAAKGSRAPSAMRALIAASLVAKASGCSYGGVLPFTSNICVIKPEGLIECALTSSFQAILPNLGTQLCIQLGDQDGVPSGLSMEIEYTKSNIGYDLVQGYYTSDWSFYSKEVKKCSSLTSNCEGKCASLNPFDKTARGNINDAIISSWPGRSSCTSRNGCSNNGCTSCGKVCYWKSYSIVPTARKARVQTIGQQRTNPCVMITLRAGAAIIHQNEHCFGSPTLTFSNFSSSIFGTLAFDPPTFPYEHLVDVTGCSLTGCSPEVAIAHASSANNPTARLVGDIQGNAPTKFTSSGVNNFIFDTDMFENQEAAGLKYFATTTSKMVLPSVVNGGRFVYDRAANRLVSDNYETGALVLQMDTVNPITYSLTIQAVCPAFTIERVDGCGACVQGFSIVVSAHSTCGPGGMVAAVITCEEGSANLATSTLILTNSSSRYTIFATSGVHDLSCKLSLVYSYRDIFMSDAHDFVAHLRTQEEIDDMIHQNNTSIKEDGGGVKFFGTGKEFLENFLEFGGNWKQKIVGFLIWAGMLAVGFLVVTLFGPKVVSLVKSSLMTKGSMKAGKTA